MKLGAWAINTALTTAYVRPHRRLLGIRDVRSVQEGLLSGMLHANADSRFGRAHGFARIASVAAYQAAVPLSTWDDYAADVAAIMAGEQGVLTSEPVRLLEPSSGSTAATKLIPYTRTLSAQFRAGIEPWLHDLYRNFPAVRRGRSYWSITPAAMQPRRESAVPIGFDDDSDYLGPIAGRALQATLAVDQKVAGADSVSAWRVASAKQLIAADDLALVSVWNPTFWTLLLDWMSNHADSILADVRAERRPIISSAVRAGDWRTVWPDLAVISCWADANAAAPAAELAARFPGVTIQPKGLLATEALISVPIMAAGGAVFSARSHFVEFRSEAGDCLLADELILGQTYEIVITTGGGLYRYRLGDLVEVTGRFGALPVLRFIGRADQVSDLVGEKLSEPFAASCLAHLGVEGFAMLTPEGQPSPDHYVLWTNTPEQPILAERLDAALRESFHYDYARRVGQLRPVQVVRVGPDAPERYLAACVARGQRLGDVKPAALVRTSGWADVFETH